MMMSVMKSSESDFVDVFYSFFSFFMYVCGRLERKHFGIKFLHVNSLNFSRVGRNEIIRSNFAREIEWSLQGMFETLNRWNPMCRCMELF